MYSDEKSERKVLENNYAKMQTQMDIIFGYCQSQMMGGSSTLIPKVASMPTSEMVGGSSSPTHQPIPTPHANRSSESLLTPDRVLSMPKKIGRSSSTLPSIVMGNGSMSPLGERDSSTNIEPTPAARLCELLDWNMNLVAFAKEITDPMHKGMCHGYRLKPECEMKVSMCVRKVYPAKLYKETPDAKTIQEVGVGDFLVWPKSHIRFMELVQ